MTRLTKTSYHSLLKDGAVAQQQYGEQEGDRNLVHTRWGLVEHAGGGSCRSKRAAFFAPGVWVRGGALGRGI